MILVIGLYIFFGVLLFAAGILCLIHSVNEFTRKPENDKPSGNKVIASFFAVIGIGFLMIGGNIALTFLLDFGII